VRGPAGKVAYRRRTPTTPSLRRCQTERYGPTSVQKARRRVLDDYDVQANMARAPHLEGASALVRLADRSNSLPDVSIPNR
jgi:hypothetical protein